LSRFFLPFSQLNNEELTRFAQSSAQCQKTWRRYENTTDEADVHLRAMPHADWRLIPGSGSVRLELPPAVSFELEAANENR
jgi:hypothetical protein